MVHQSLQTEASEYIDWMRRNHLGTNPAHYVLVQLCPLVIVAYVTKH